MKSLITLILIMVYSFVYSIPADTLKSIQAALVIVKTENATGSGFIISMNKKKYLITNEHIVRSGTPTFNLLNGQTIKLLKMELADTEDLVRFEVEKDYDALDLKASVPSIGEKIFVLGNSDGAGVVTLIDGKILGVGPNLLEVDAPFIIGNSGSPIVNSNGEVYTVATFATFFPGQGDPFRKDTRFNDVRRFGVRLTDDIKWVPFTWGEYKVLVNTLKDFVTFMNDFFDIMYTDKYIIMKGSAIGGVYFECTYDFMKKKDSYLAHPILCKFLSDLAKDLTQNDINRSELICKLRYVYNKRSLKSPAQYDQDIFRVLWQVNNADNMLGKIILKHLKNMSRGAIDILMAQNWKTRYLRDEANIHYRIYRELYRQIPQVE